MQTRVVAWIARASVGSGELRSLRRSSAGCGHKQGDGETRTLFCTKHIQWNPGAELRLDRFTGWPSVTCFCFQAGSIFASPTHRRQADRSSEFLPPPVTSSA